MSYTAFLEQKKRIFYGDGLIATRADLPPMLYAWQSAITKWALKKGRAAIFADCGLGKTFMQTAWADALVRAAHVKGEQYSWLSYTDEA